MWWRLHRVKEGMQRLFAQRMFWPALIQHSPTPLDIPTYDGSNQATHPDVVCFANPWHGFRYWMVMTPYPFLDETLENPSVLVSNDGISWQVPVGGMNPLVATPEKGFHADPDMIYHPQTDGLWIYYLHTLRGEVQYLKRICSQDGLVWTPPETILTLPYQKIRSPALVVVPGGGLCMWSVNVTDGAVLEMRDSSNGVEWSSPQEVQFCQPGYMPSHLDVVWDSVESKYGMVAQCIRPQGGPNLLFWAESGDGVAWRTGRCPLLGVGKAPDWAKQTLYRSTFVWEKKHVRLWYSGRSIDHHNRIAETVFDRSRLDRSFGRHL
ncbi:MAG: hypothetical protein H7832_03070 [Magnetococcus sp. DMHC-6]